MNLPGGSEKEKERERERERELKLEQNGKKRRNTVDRL